VPTTGRGPKSGAPPSGPWHGLRRKQGQRATAPPPRDARRLPVMRRSASTCAAAVRARARAAASSASEQVEDTRSASGPARARDRPRSYRRDRREPSAPRSPSTRGDRPRVAACISAGGWVTARRNSASSTNRRGLEAIQRHARGGPAPARRRASRSWSRATTSCRSAGPAGQRRVGLDHGVSVRRGREHVHVPANDVVGKISPPAAPAPAPGERLRHADRAVDRPLPACRPAHRSASGRGRRSLVLSESNTLVVTLVRNWLDNTSPSPPERDERIARRGPPTWRPSPFRPTRSALHQVHSSVRAGMAESDARRWPTSWSGRSARRRLPRVSRV